MAPTELYINDPQVKNKVAAFDYDWTLVKPLDGRTHAKDANDRQWFRESVPGVLRNLHERDFALVVFTNQTHQWKVGAIRAQLELLGLPMTVLIGFAKDDRKPSTAMWEHFTGANCDRRSSFYVGDAAGRKGDWSDTDKLFAEAIALKFKVPEDVFPYVPKYVAPDAVQPITKMREVVVLVGYPGSGKSTVALRLAESGNAQLIDGDSLKTAAKMVKAAMACAPLSPIFDATNGTLARRAPYIAFAKAHGLHVRAIWIDAPIDVAMANAAYRESLSSEAPHIPKVAFYTYRKRFEEPTLEEGFASVQRITLQ